jgi:hypothetical protein
MGQPLGYKLPRKGDSNVRAARSISDSVTACIYCRKQVACRARSEPSMYKNMMEWLRE